MPLTPIFEDKVSRVANDYVMQYQNALQVADFRVNVLQNTMNVEQVKHLL